MLRRILAYYKQNPKRLIPVLLSFIGLVFIYYLLVYLTTVYFVRPEVIGSSPITNDTELPLDSNITLVFSREMDNLSVEDAFNIEPAIEGTLSWNNNILTFDPKENFTRDQNITVTLKRSAKGKNLRYLKEDFVLNFSTLSNPHIAMASPTGSVAEEVNNIVIMFNKSVRKPDSELLLVEPEIEYESKWVGSSAYVLKPKNLKKGTTYKITLNESLESLDGGVLDKGYTFEFTNFAPAVYSAIADSSFGTTNDESNPNGPITVYFNQALDKTSIKENLAFTNLTTLEEVPYNLYFYDRTAADDSYYYYQEWQSKWKQRIEIIPVTALDPNQNYRVEVFSGFTSLEGDAGAESGLVYDFKTSKEPGFISSNIANGSENIDQQTRLTLHFQSPMNSDELDRTMVVKENGNIVSNDYFISAYSPGKQVTLNKFLTRSTKYDVFIPFYTKDKFGRSLGEDINLSFTTAPYNPAVSFQPGYTYFATFADNLDTRLISRAVNIDNLEYSLYSLDINKFISLYGYSRQHWQNLNHQILVDSGFTHLGDWTQNIELEKDIHTDVLFNFNSAASKDLVPGFYFVDVHDVTNKNIHDNMALIIGDVSVTTKSTPNKYLAWATSLSKRSVKRGYNVKVYNLPSSYNQSQGSLQSNVNLERKSILEGVTNDDGVFLADKNLTSDNNIYLTLVEKDGDLGVSFSNWTSGIDSYEFGNVDYDYYLNRNGPDKYKAFAYLDRTLYRPGQPLYYNAFIRANDLYTYSKPSNLSKKFFIKINSQSYGSGSSIYSQEYDIADSENFSGEFILPEGLALGRYSLSVVAGDSTLYSTSFDVQEYIRPEFEITAQVPSENVIRGGSVGLSSLASYFYGAPVVNSPLDYRVFKRNYIFNYSKDDSYTFYSRRKYYGDDTYWRGFEEEEVTSGSVYTDSNGKHAFNVSTNTQEGVSEIYTFESDVLDTSGRKLTGSNEYVVHMAKHYTGIKSSSYIGLVGDTSEFNVLTVKPDESIEKNVKVNVNVYLRKYFRVKKKDNSEGYLYETTYKDELVHTSDLTPDDMGKGTFEYTPEVGGLHIIEVESFDSSGNRSVSDLFHYVSSNESGYWRKENNNRIDLITDKQEYKVGDNAEVLPVSTFEEAIGLLTIEAEDIFEYDVFKQDASSEVQKFEIKESFIPNIYVSMMLVKPGENVFNPAEFNMGITNINVDSSQYLLDVDISTSKEVYAPQESGDIKVVVKDINGNIVPNSSVTIALVDDSLMSIASLKRDNAYEHFYSKRNHAVKTTQSLTSSLDRINLNTEIGAKGGSGSKGGAGGEYVDLTRSNFAETALWLPETKTDASGVAYSKFTLPDSITRWNLFALVQDSSGGKYGQNIYKFGSVRELFGSPALPRFIRIGDTFELGIVIHNNSSNSKNVNVGVDAEGLQINDDYYKSLTVEANSSKKLVFNSSAQEEGTAKITFTVQENGVNKDVIVKEFEVLPFGLEVVQSVSNSATYGAIEEFDLPSGANTNFGGLEIEVYSSLIGLTNSSLDKLLFTQYYSTSNVSSKALPLIYKYRLAKFNDSIEGAASNEQTIKNFMFLLNSVQHSDGGWGYWIDTNSDVYNTSRVLEVFGDANKDNIVIDQKSLDRGVHYLEDQLNKGNVSEESLPYVLYVLELNGIDQTGRIQNSYERRVVLPDHSKAYLVLAMHENAGSWKKFINQLKSELVLKADLGSRRVFWSSPSGSWYIGDEEGTTAVVLRAFNKTDPSSPVADLAIRYLTQNTSNHKYISYNERLKITSLIENVLERKIKPRTTNLEVIINDKSVANTELQGKELDSKYTLDIPTKDLITGLNTTEIKFSNGGSAFYNMVLTSLLPFDVVDEMSNDIAMSREILDVNGNVVKDNTFKVGENYVVRLTIATPNSRRNLLLEDFLPAGFESVNETLKNESKLVAEAVQVPTDGAKNLYYINSLQFKDSVTEIQMSYLPKGLYEYTYVVRAIVPGEFKLRPAHIYEQSSPDVRANTNGMLIKVID